MGERDNLNDLKTKRSELVRELADLKVSADTRPGEYEVLFHDLTYRIALQDSAIKTEEARLYAQGL